MRFDIAAMVRRVRNPRRSRIILRPIIPTAALASDLYVAGYKPVIEAWRRAIERIGPAYERALPVKDSGLLNDAIFDLDSILAAIEGELQQLVIAITPRLRAWSVRAEQWHRGQWQRSLLAGAGIDVQTLLDTSDTDDTLGAFLSRNVALIRSVSDEARQRVSDIVLRGYQVRAPLRTVAKEMAEAVDMGRKRALRIASDQNSKMAARLDQARQDQAGITQFAWHHSFKEHPRPWHQAREGKVYDWSTLHEVDGPDQVKTDDTPGTPPFCGCRARAVIDLS